MSRGEEMGRFHMKHTGKNEHLTDFEHRQRQEHGGNRSLPDLRRERNYLKSPDDLYMYETTYTSVGHNLRKGVYTKALNEPVLDKNRPSYLRYQPLYHSRPKRNRKALIIGERPSLWKSDRHERPELPGNIFIDNLRYRNIEWADYRHVTWNQILESHKKDVDAHRTFIQTLPQKEAWLASIDPRYDIHKHKSDTSLPHISPRLFKPKSVPRRPPQPLRYKARDGMGTMYYLEGPSDVTNKAYRKLVFPEIPKRAKPPKQLDF